ncbi:hypothetical protein CCAN11_2450031 [Capnocytophaga canimorsus]|uniref:Uncharacterized protein n=1 Tax=Capnocytophaga canimorsus TaxID=28188 RepID=A0A0B7IKM2_9FLAO|nr:hypothetical protein [Capnocytophaga canimorsus]CEN52431.1 hypothetical protein CCAN11_2450031 [Capnocytophaga canimorsus]
MAQTQQMIANLNTMVAQIQQGKGNVGKLVNDEQLYKNLEKATKELELLLQDFRLNPKRYVHFSVLAKKPNLTKPLLKKPKKPLKNNSKFNKLTYVLSSQYYFCDIARYRYRIFFKKRPKIGS